LRSFEVDGEIEQIPTKLMIDTGAGISLVSQAIASISKREVQPSTIQLINASGQYMKVVGEIDLEVELRSVTTHTFVVVDDVNQSAIIGMDWLKKNDAVIDVGKQELIVDGIKIDHAMTNESELIPVRAIELENDALPWSSHEKKGLGL
jgi:predicted aspartyl protease